MLLAHRLREDMFHPPPSSEQRIGHKRAVAAPRQGLCAHNGNLRLRCVLHKTREPLFKCIRLHVVRIPPKRGVVPTQVDRIFARVAQPPKLLHMGVSNPLSLERLGKRLLVKLRVVPRAGHRADVDEVLDPVRLDQRKQLREAARGMAHSVQDGWGRLGHLHRQHSMRLISVHTGRSMAMPPSEKTVLAT